MGVAQETACRRQDPELFFPIGSGDCSGDSALHQMKEARAVCRRCPAVEPCLTWATANGPVAGIWGGTTEAERASARRRGVRLAAVAPARVYRQEELLSC